MAIAMALNGGLGLIHYNMPGKDQIKEVARVKRHIHGLIQDPITVAPGAAGQRGAGDDRPANALISAPSPSSTTPASWSASSRATSSRIATSPERSPRS
jgi:IMP dehydrogenase/GMP reductase